MFFCRHCRRDDFTSEYGLTQHQNQGLCRTLKLCELGVATEAMSPHRTRSSMVHEGNGGKAQDAPAPPQKQGGIFRNVHDLADDDLEAVTQGMAGLMAAETGAEDLDSEAEDDDSDCGPPVMEDAYSTDEEDDDEEVPPSVSQEPIGTAQDGPITWLHDQFHEYVDGKVGNILPFTEAEATSIRLLHHLKKKGSALNTYPEIMEWYLRESNAMEDYEQLKDCSSYISRDKIMKKLKERYNMGNKHPYRKKVKLPMSGTVIRLTLQEPGAALQSLLTDPRIQDDNYLFFDDDPLAPPPAEFKVVSELNTARAFRDT